MTIDAVGFDEEEGFGEWLRGEQAKALQGYLEHRLVEVLCSYDPSSLEFQRMIAQLAWLGATPDARPLLEREIQLLFLSNDLSVQPCDFWKDVGKVCKSTWNGCKAVYHFVVDHKEEIAVGLAVAATGVGIVYVTGYVLSVSVAGVVVVGAGSIFASQEAPNPHIPKIPLPDPKTCSKEELALWQQSAIAALPKLDLPSSIDQIVITPSGVWAGGNFYPSPNPQSPLASGYPADWKEYTSYRLATQFAQNSDLRLRGENALAIGAYSEAICDLSQSIQQNPTDSLSYLERGVAQFHLQNYDQAVQDYQHFASQEPREPPPLSIAEFSLGFAKGLPQGAWESGEGLLLFIGEFATAPVQTSKQVFQSLHTLVELARSDEWGEVAHSLSPELHELVTQWDTLSSERRGELAGYAMGKLGSDILIPGALGKVASKSLRTAEELAAVCKNLQIAEGTLLVEAAAGVGNGAKVGELIEASQRMSFLGRELGFTAEEVTQLKQAGKLEGTINNGLEKLASQSESEVLKSAIHQNKHVKMVRDYLDKPTEEIQKGINSYEKQIALHKDKIANPEKYYPDWNKLDPRQREALVNKKWPVEIQVYEEQKNVLESILKERISCE